jgi:hypothetical protein
VGIDPCLTKKFIVRCLLSLPEAPTGPIVSSARKRLATYVLGLLCGFG